MKKLIILVHAVIFAACTNNTKSAGETSSADSASASQDTTAVVAEPTVEAPSVISDKLPVTKEETLKAWRGLRDYIDGGDFDSYLCYDVDGDGVHEVFLANRRIKDGQAQAVFTVENGKLKCLAHTTYPMPGAPVWRFYIGQGYIHVDIQGNGNEYTSYILKNSKVVRIAYNSMNIVGWDEENDKPIYEFGEEGQPMIGKDFEHLEPSDEAMKYLNTKSLTEINKIEGWQKL